jgi:hypothetical protein
MPIRRNSSPLKPTLLLATGVVLATESRTPLCVIIRCLPRFVVCPNHLDDCFYHRSHSVEDQIVVAVFPETPKTRVIAIQRSQDHSYPPSRLLPLYNRGGCLPPWGYIAMINLLYHIICKSLRNQKGWLSVWLVWALVPSFFVLASVFSVWSL